LNAPSRSGSSSFALPATHSFAVILRRAFGIATANIDGLLLGLVVVLLGLGLAVLYSASNESSARLVAQGANIGVAFTVMWVASKIPPHHLMRIALPAYLFGLFLLVAAFQDRQCHPETGVPFDRQCDQMHHGRQRQRAQTGDNDQNPDSGRPGSRRYHRHRQHRD
jgi:hypothetical protein